MPKEGNGKYFKPYFKLALSFYSNLYGKPFSHFLGLSREEVAEAECREGIRCEVLPEGIGMNSQRVQSVVSS